ncbi:DUF1127 domain-containing protein [Roseovarius amoyensis]|uniref:DUF1127 domain-containing protein n=1 Tax=Roseovarius amoyensis TaxID=2211448 RepID=UPI00195503A0|nr:DUF1127 domain-containing protein [Roseovarius amoyensis]
MQPILSHRNGQRQSQLNLRALAMEPQAGSGVFGQWLRAAIRQRQRRRMIAALQALDDRTLRDIGLYRGDIPRLVAGFSDCELGMRPPRRAGRPTQAPTDRVSA